VFVVDMFHKNTLPLTDSYAKQLEIAKYLRNDKIIILQHLRPDTEQFIDILHKTWVEIYRVIWKPFSVDQEVKRNIEKKWILVDVYDYKHLDESSYTTELLSNAIKDIKNDLSKVLVLEVWWYFVKAIANLEPHDRWKLGWVVEITKFGHNRYASLLDTVGHFNTSVVSLAESNIKEIEAKFATQAWLEAVNMIFRELWRTIYWKKVGLIWYGMIHQNLAKWLQSYKCTISTYDTANKYQQARQDALDFVVDKYEFLASSTLLFSATAQQSISLSEIERFCQDGVVLIAMWSRWQEFPIVEMNQFWKKTKIHPHVDLYITTNGKKVFVLYEWKAINYLLKSCPNEVMDPYFAEMLVALKNIRLNNLSKTQIHTIDPYIQKQIIDDWSILIQW
jgi:S-adenosylhomocysteine hydrolase